MNYLKRLSDANTFNDVLPWDFVPEPRIPEEVRADKKARTVWINQPETVHHVYSGMIGINPNGRVSKPNKEGGGNPPLFCTALVADYDNPAREVMVLELARKMPFPPNYIEKTLSGNWRFVWVLENPLRFPSYSFAVHFLQTFSTFAFDVSRGMIGFDKPAWEAPERLWTNGCDWRPCEEKQIPDNVAQGWLVKAAEKFEFSQREFGAAIDLEVVAPALAEKYPSFASWPGEFILSSRGPTFWVPESKSPLSATVYENGIRTFSEHASKTFYSWADLLGMDFVKQHQAEQAGRAAKDIYYDGKNYWRKFADETWHVEDPAVLARHLVVQRKVSKKSDKDTPISELERTLDYITGSQKVDGALPVVFKPSGLWHDHNGRPFLNTCRVKALTPADGVAIHGPDGKFPFLSDYVWGLTTAEQLEYLLSWTKYGYENAYRQTPRSGQILFLGGPVDSGKTLFNTGVLGRLFGGSADAGPWLMGESQFNGELWGAGLWSIDDNSPSSDPARRRLWSFGVKKMAANRQFRFNEKFQPAGMTERVGGRMCVTFNVDESSVQQVPDLEVSILDKLIIILAQSFKGTFPANLTEILDREMSWFARYLLQYQIPEHILGGTRFGIKSYANPLLVDMARMSSQQAGFSEMMEVWKREWFLDHKGKEFWQGTALELYMDLNNDPRMASAARRMTPDSIGRSLSAMKNKLVGWVETVDDANSENRVWRIYKDEKRKSTLDIPTDSK